MSSIQIGGLGADFTTDPNITLKNILSDNWPAGGAASDTDLKKYDISTNPTGVKFLTSWYDGQTWYQVVVKPLVKNTETFTLGATEWEVESFHNIHVFAKGKNAKDKRWKLEKEIRNQIQIREGTTSNGVQLFIMENFREFPAEDQALDMEHSMASVKLMWHEFKV